MQAQETFSAYSLKLVNSYTIFPYQRTLAYGDYFHHINYRHSTTLEGSLHAKYVDVSAIFGRTFKRHHLQIGTAVMFHPLSFVRKDHTRAIIEPYLRAEYQMFIRSYWRQGNIAPRRYNVLSFGAGIEHVFRNKLTLNTEYMLFGFNDFRLGFGRRF